MSEVHFLFVASQYSLDSKCEAQLELWDAVIKGKEEQGTVLCNRYWYACCEP